MLSDTVDIDADHGQRRQVGRMKRVKVLAIHLEGAVAPQQFVVKQNGHFGYAVIAGQQ